MKNYGRYDMRRARRPLAVAAACAAALAVASCGSDKESAPAEKQTNPVLAVATLQDKKTVGLVPGIVTFKNGDTTIRPLAEADGEIACSGGDGTVQDNANSFVYLKDGQAVRESMADVKRVKIYNLEYVEKDGVNPDAVLRQCVTAEGFVEVKENSLCVPVGVPNPNDARLILAAVANAAQARQIAYAGC